MTYKNVEQFEKDLTKRIKTYLKGGGKLTTKHFSKDGEHCALSAAFGSPPLDGSHPVNFYSQLLKIEEDKLYAFIAGYDGEYEHYHGSRYARLGAKVRTKFKKDINPGVSDW